MGGGRNPPIKHWDGDAEIAGHIAGRDAAGESFWAALILLSVICRLRPPFAAKLASDFEIGAVCVRR